MARAFDRKIILEDGSEYYGYAFGADEERVCELVFNTCMVGYQEIVTDPTYTGQAVVMSYPLIGNYGITDEDNESKAPAIGALIVREYCDSPSNFRYTKTLSETLEEAHIPGIYGFDTRKLTTSLRDTGTKRVLITSAETTVEEGLKIIAQTPERHDLVKSVSCKKRWYSRTQNHTYDVVAIDCGIKHSLIKELNKRSCNVTIMPYNTTAEEVMALSPDGVFISNGPGNPQDVPEVPELVKSLHGKLPLFGVGLGHELIALSYGAETYKLKFGHRGGNHPIKTLETGRIETCLQSHSYAVDEKSLENTALEVTHIDILDNTVEGIECKADKVFSVQFTPDGGVGPEGSVNLYDKFISNMEESKNA